MNEAAKKTVLRRFPYGLYAVTVAHGGEEHGMTANWVSQAAFEPPMVVVAVENTSKTIGMIRDAHHFAINVLCANQHYLSRQFSTPAEDKFAGVEFEEGSGGVPILGGVLAHFVCRNVRQVEAGDHVIVIGEVEHFESSEGEPLVFHSGAYRVATRHPELETS